MHYFRGFAIVNIVIVHYLSAAGCDFIKNAFFQNATVYFLFISGYLCQFLDLKKPKSALDYYKAKVANVLSPYLVWSLVFFTLSIFLPPHEGANLMDRGHSPLAFLWYLLTGRVSFQFWYIPFVTVLFLVSPLLLKLKNAKLIASTFIAGVLFFLFPERPLILGWPPNVLFNLYCHFTVFYLLGFLYARYKVEIDDVLGRHLGLVVALFALVTTLIVKPDVLGMATISVWTLQSIQKLLVSVLIIRLFDFVRDRRIAVLDALARYSFTLYFVHCYFLTECMMLRQPLARMIGGFADVLLIPLYILALLGVSALMKTALGSRSRMVIGA